jgi:hypothetical protein
MVSASAVAIEMRWPRDTKSGFTWSRLHCPNLLLASHQQAAVSLEHTGLIILSGQARFRHTNGGVIQNDAHVSGNAHAARMGNAVAIHHQHIRKRLQFG